MRIVLKVVSVLMTAFALRSFFKAAKTPTHITGSMAGIRHIRADTLHVSKPTWWLESRFHFSFADYLSYDKLNFGALRVLNDDLVKPSSGFGRHPHRDAEIFSYIVDGELSHADSLGNKEALGRGCVQYLSAGSGITHSELNDHPHDTCRFLQVWITPDARGHTPQYGSQRHARAERHNKLLHVVGGTGALPQWDDVHGPSGIRLHQDVHAFVSESDAGRQFEISLAAGRQAYLVCIEGSLDVNRAVAMTARDAAELVAEDGAARLFSLQMGPAGAHFMLIEMKRDGTRSM